MRGGWLFFVLGLTFCAHAFASEAAAGTQTWTYLDYGGNTQSVSFDENTATATLSDFNAPVKLSEEIDNALTSGEPKTKVTVDHDTYPVHSLTLSKDAAAIKDIRRNLNEMQKNGAIQVSGDQLCPEASDRTMTILLRDVPFAFTFCLQKK